MKSHIWAILAAGFALMPAAATAWLADNRHEVNMVSDTEFEVVGRSGSGGPEFWCAAGDFSRQVLGASATQRIYLVRGPEPALTRNWDRAVLFSLVPPQDVDLRTGFFLSVTRIGDNVGTASAMQYCSDNKVRES